MQYEPSAAELLAAIAELLEGDVLAALPDELRHRGRVAANLARILEREERLGPEATARERERLAGLLGPAAGDEPDVTALSAALVERIRTGDDPAFERRAWDAVVAITRDDLAVAKPGHDAWEAG